MSERIPGGPPTAVANDSLRPERGTPPGGASLPQQDQWSSELQRAGVLPGWARELDCDSRPILLASHHEVPAGDDWLGGQEIAQQDRFTRASRRRDFRLGRFVGKRALRLLRPNVPFARLQIIAATDGAPDPFEGDRALPLSLSLSHRAGVACCALTHAPNVVGCDLELIERRSARFVADYFTEPEQRVITSLDESRRDLAVTLCWSAKESALKCIRQGLRRDTRSLEVDLRLALGGGLTDPSGRLVVRDLEQEHQTFRGTWSHRDRLLVTVLSATSLKPHR